LGKSSQLKSEIYHKGISFVLLFPCLLTYKLLLLYFSKGNSREKKKIGSKTSKLSPHPLLDMKTRASFQNWIVKEWHEFEFPAAVVWMFVGIQRHLYVWDVILPLFSIHTFKTRSKDENCHHLVLDHKTARIHFQRELPVKLKRLRIHFMRKRRWGWIERCRPWFRVPYCCCIDCFWYFFLWKVMFPSPYPSSFPSPFHVSISCVHSKREPSSEDEVE